VQADCRQANQGTCRHCRAYRRSTASKCARVAQYPRFAGAGRSRQPPFPGYHSTSGRNLRAGAGTIPDRAQSGCGPSATASI